MYITHFVRSTVDEYLGCFCILALVNNVAVNMRIAQPLQDPDFNSLGHRPRSGIAGLYAYPFLIFEEPPDSLP